MTERFLLQPLVCGTVFHRTSLLPSSLSIFCCRCCCCCCCDSSPSVSYLTTASEHAVVLYHISSQLTSFIQLRLLSHFIVPAHSLSILKWTQIVLLLLTLSCCRNTELSLQSTKLYTRSWFIAVQEKTSELKEHL